MVGTRFGDMSICYQIIHKHHQLDAWSNVMHTKYNSEDIEEGKNLG
ncbi:hypothetical protein HanXRQr2_Chr16g0746191 [Helianthus annuus]|uniref:Uncharacterized protein n=1 Tax=Helianthus annuus TaxID=4232 RepID=A0A9K3GYI5_HELAN|nr:hypothetical protein HanXRQr2_Chr16g0746191 [Helianthus annuus]KAJ0830311.1 hypothetical protein HanPSC8_Chr15g0653881 [Helianthus annuus]